MNRLSFGSPTRRARAVVRTWNEQVLSAERLEQRMLLSAAVSAVRTGVVGTEQAVIAPLVSKLEKVTKADKGVALTTAFGAVAKLKAPTKNSSVMINPSAYAPVSVNLRAMNKALSSVPDMSVGGVAAGTLVNVPSPDGTLALFRIVESSVMAPSLQAKYDNIHTYLGQGVDDPMATIALDVTTNGFHASVLGGVSGDWYVDPYWKGGTAQYVSYYKKDLANTQTGWDEDESMDEAGDEVASDASNDGDSGEFTFGSGPLNVVTGAQLRTFDLVVAATGEYTTFWGGQTNALSAIVNAVSRLNQVYQRDLAIQFQLVANETAVIYTSASTDPFTSPTANNTTLNQAQNAFDTLIGNANYDIGHIFHNGNTGGVAGSIGNVGITGQKGKGFSGFSPPTNDPFVIDYVAHEMGHQFGGRHNFSSVGGGPGDDSAIAVEPGSGQTVMSYAGIGDSGEDTQAHSNAMFNSINIEQITTYVSSGTLGATITSTGNTAPTVSVGAANYNIPLSAPFALTAIASDVNGDALTYSWEQRNGASGVTATPVSTRTTGPAFRVFDPVASETRTFPKLSTVLAGQTSTPSSGGFGGGETLPSVVRTMNFVVTVRDNRAGGGATNSATTAVTTVAGTAFSLTSFNSATSVNGGTSQAITWTNTNTGAGTTVNAGSVNILLSTDGGTTFPITLASNVSNDGSETVTLPYNLGTTTARIKIVPTNNIFFDINNASFTIVNVTSPVNAPALQVGSDTGVSSGDRVTRYNNSSAATKLAFDVTGSVAGATVEVLSDGVVIGSAVASGATATVITNGTTTLADGPHAITARQTLPSALTSPISSSLSITVDTVAPTLVGTPVYSYLTPTPTQSLSYQFSEDVSASVGLGDISVTRGGSAVAAVVSGAGTGVTVDFGGVLADGRYVAAIQAGAITDVAGNSVATGTFEFFFLRGDADHNATVDIFDFQIWRNHFGQSGTFADGDFNFDGTVDIFDFQIWRNAFGTSV